MKDTLMAIIFAGLFGILFLPLYVENDFFFPFITGKNFAFRIIVEIVFASWVLLALLDTKYRPKFSWILVSFLSLLGVMAVANVLGEYPLKSFMSNFERMDGYVTLVHVFLLTVVLGSVFQRKEMWSYFLHTSIVVAVLTAIYGLGQQVGIFEGGRNRVDSRLGNAAYMAVYMLFHIFFIYFLALKTKNKTMLMVYALAGLILAYTMLQTGTRGTFIGLVGGSLVTVGYVALFGRKDPVLRKYALGGLFILAVLSIGFYGIKDTQYVQDTNALKRIANINLQEDLAVRGQIWSVAMEGVEERPLLGWGQGNFNYVFNEHYQPELWNQEQWFDRVHNIFLDWLIAGGVLGFVAYFSIFAAVAYYLVIRSQWLKKESPFSVPEQAVLLGLLTAYLLHNVVVFDNIISYIFFATLLAYVHHRVARPIAAVEQFEMSPLMIGQFVTPVVIIVTGFAVYLVNVPGILATSDVIDALTADTVRGRLEEFHSALSRDSFARQEIVEQLAQQAMQITSNQNIPDDERRLITQRAELELLALAEDKPNDARVHNFISSFYRTIGAFEKAQEQAQIAHTLSPEKPTLIIEQALVELQLGNLTAAREYLETAYNLAPDNRMAVIFYAAVLFQIGESELAKEIVGDEFKKQFAANEYAISVVEAAGELDYLAELFKLRIAENPNDAQNRASLAYVYYEQGEVDKAIEVLEAAAIAVPSFSATAACYVSNMEAGITPTTPCTEETQ